MQRLLDVIIGFPGLILGHLLVAILGPGWFPLFLTIMIIGLPPAGRLARGAWLTQQDREYVLAAAGARRRPTGSSSCVTSAQRDRSDRS